MTWAFSRNKGARGERPAGNWRQVKAWPSYWVSDEGLVWSEASSRLLSGLTSRDGYRKIHLTGQGHHEQRFVHRLVAELWVEGSGEQVRHIDGDKLNNRAENLAWGTCRENIMDKWTHGKMPHGEGHHANKIPVSDIPAIRASAESNTAIATRYGVSRAAIYAIKVRKSYDWL